MGDRASAGAAAWVASALLAWAFAWLATWLLDARLSPDLVPLAGSAAAWVGGALFLAPLAAESERPLPALALAAALTGALTTLLLLVRPAGGALLYPVLITSMMLFLTAALVRVASPRPEGRAAAHAWVLVLVAWVAASPVWLAPLIDLTAPPRGISNALIAVNPLTHLAASSGLDYLRSDWFYRHSPFGGLRYDYPTPGSILTGYLIACTLAALTVARTQGLARRRPPTLRTQPPISLEVMP